MALVTITNSFVTAAFLGVLIGVLILIRSRSSYLIKMAITFGA